MEYRKIYHVSDLHIRENKQFDRRAEYETIFGRMMAKIAEDTEAAILVIAGDIFHDKMRWHVRDIEPFCNLLRRLDDLIPTVIIPGNHDMNLNSDEYADLILPIIGQLNLKQIYYYHKSGVYKHGNINFVHLSAYDKIIPELPARKSPNEVNVALLHEDIGGAKFGGYTFKDKRIDVEFLEQYDITIAGHIHDCLFIRPNIAYCGSLIQQNLGESPVKGMILWDIPKRTGQFIRVPNERGFSRIIAQNNRVTTNLEELPKNPWEVSIIDKNCSREFVDDLARKYNAKIKRITDESVIVDNCCEIEEKLCSVEDHNSLIREYLEALSVSGTEIANIIAKHAEYIKGRYLGRVINNKRWNLRKMMWSGLLCYGGENMIDFTKITDISGVVAKNKYGKSSLIDILIFGLFHKCTRGDRNTIQNMNSKNGYSLIIEFEVDGEIYTIEKFARHKDKPSVKFTRGDTDLTRESIDKTYEEISKIIGTYEETLRTIIMLQYDNNSLHNLNNNQKFEFLQSVLGIDILREICADAKNDLRELKARARSAKKPAMDEEEANKALEAAESELKAVNESLAKYKDELDEYLRKKDALLKEYVEYEPSQKIAAKIKELQGGEPIKKPKMTIDELRGLIRPVPIAHHRPRRELEKELAEIIPKTRNLQRLADKDAKISRRAELGAELKHLPAPKKSGGPSQNLAELESTAKMARERAEANRPILEQIRADLRDLRRETPKNIPNRAANCSLGDLFARLADLGEGDLGQIPILRHKISKIPHDNIDNLRERYGRLIADFDLAESEIFSDNRVQKLATLDSLVENVKKEILAIKSREKYKFNENCNECSTNKQILAEHLAARETYLKELEQQNAENKRNNAIFEAREIGEKMAKINAGDQAKKELSRLEQIEELNADIDAVKLREKAAQNRAKIEELEQRENELENEAKCADDAEYAYKAEKAADICAEMERIKKELEGEALLDELDNIQAELDSAKIAEENGRIMAEIEEGRKWESYQARLAEIERLSAEYLAAQKSEKICAELRVVEQRISELAEKRQSATERRAALLVETSRLERELDDAVEYSETMEKLGRELSVQETYVNMLDGKKGLPRIILAKKMAAIEANINKMLRSITDFVIRADILESKINISVSAGNSYIPLDLSSGFQKFIVGLCARICFSRMSLSPLGNFIIIDEGFACLDRENLAGIENVLGWLSRIYRHVFVITHLEELQAKIECPLFIVRNDGNSCIKYCENKGDLARLDQVGRLLGRHLVHEDIYEKTADGRIFCKFCKKTIAATSASTHLKTKTHLTNSRGNGA